MPDCERLRVCRTALRPAEAFGPQGGSSIMGIFLSYLFRVRLTRDYSGGSKKGAYFRELPIGLFYGV